MKGHHSPGLEHRETWATRRQASLIIIKTGGGPTERNAAIPPFPPTVHIYEQAIHILREGEAVARRAGTPFSIHAEVSDGRK